MHFPHLFIVGVIPFILIVNDNMFCNGMFEFVPWVPVVRSVQYVVLTLCEEFLYITSATSVHFRYERGCFLLAAPIAIVLCKKRQKHILPASTMAFARPPM